MTQQQDGGLVLIVEDNRNISEMIGEYLETRGFEVDYVVPQHCTGAEALVRLAQRMGRELVVSSTGSTFTFG